MSNKFGHDTNCGKIGNPIGLDKKFFKKMSNIRFSFLYDSFLISLHTSERSKHVNPYQTKSES